MSQLFQLPQDIADIAGVSKEFADEFLAPNAVAWDRDKHFPVDVLRKAAELGMGGMYVSEDVGGSGLSRLAAAAIIESLATGDPSIASYLSIHNMTAWMLDAFGSDELRQRYLPQMCAMEYLGSYCLTEPGAGSDAAALTTKAVRSDDGSHYLLSGVKQFISGAGASRVYIVMARTGGPGPKNISAFVVDGESEGLSFGPNEIKMGWNAQPTRQVILDRVRVPASNLLGNEGDGFTIAMKGLNGGRLNIAASSLGGAQAALDKAIGYLGERQAFGAPLKSLQALQFDIAEMATSLEAARLLLWRAADALDNGDPRAVPLCAMAKKLCTDTGFEVANRALQLHGGYGYLAEYGIEKIVRDLRVHQILEGTNEIMNLIISRSVLPG
ncbi:acyl-CoA dehydrogenase family protein [Nakamurella aerolata]|uniref:Acyl-CoA dehydrogenase n=1 Tax=Nakamurella aerolata TaxID=1656892 RepID=A0A849A6B1_9ACTN|nr:acyl-CoA dehydrogenase family protein [Nakamurella aerolata]NNG34561.1 acyl-CoA dehydrogenase [Nakamurella aerolata]